MYLILMDALIEAARRRDGRSIITGNDLAEVLEDAKRDYLARVERVAEEHRATEAFRLKIDLKRIGNH